MKTSLRLTFRQRPSGQQHSREGQRVGVDHPLEVGEVGAEAALDRRQGDVYDRHVEQQHEDRDAAREQGPPLALHWVLTLHAATLTEPGRLTRGWSVTRSESGSGVYGLDREDFSPVMFAGQPAGDVLQKEVEMALSDQLTKLAARAKEAEDHAAAARDKARADAEADLETSRAAAQTQAEQLREAADAGKGKVSDWWNDVQKRWNEHVAKVQENIESKKADMDTAKAQRDADNAEDDALFAIDFAYAAIGEAEYAVLDAVVARKKADELSGAST